MGTNDATIGLTRQLGATLRAERKHLGLTQAELARRAGIGRQKLIAVEQGKPGVAVAAYAAAMEALGVAPTVRPAEVRIEKYPQLKRLIWNRPGAETLAERDALALYERHWDQVDVDQMTTHERGLLQCLVDRYGMECCMFERPHHQKIAKLLRSMDGALLTRARRYFGGGTAITLKLGEYRESVGIDFLCSDREGYRLLRNAITPPTLGSEAVKNSG